MAPIDPTVVAMAYAGRAPSQWGTDVEGVDTRLVDAGAPGAPTLALTFDACGGRGGDEVDTELLDLLVAERLPATVFLNARWIDAHPTVTDRLLAEPQFEIANHGTRHVPLSVTGRAAYGITGTDSAAAAADEVWGNHQKLTALLGHSPRWFRSGTAHYDEVAAAIATDLGQQPVGFTVNGDLGATATKAQVQRAITGAPAGAVVLCHMNHPWKGTAVGLRAALPALRAKGTRFVTVTEGGGARA